MSALSAVSLGLQAVAIETREACRQAVGAYHCLGSLADLGKELGRRLAHDGRGELAQAVGLVAIVTQQQAMLALEAGWWNLGADDRAPWDPEAEWGKLGAVEAAEALCEELTRTAEVLLLARDSVPPHWNPRLLRTVGSLLVAAAQLREALCRPV